MGILSYGYKALKGAGQAINKTKPNVPKTKLDKAKSAVALSKQKLKASTAKLGQTQFEIKNKLPITFNKTSKKTESNKEAYKRIQEKNTKVLKGMIDDAFKDKKKTKVFNAPKNFNKGGRVGLKGGTNLGMQSVKYGLDNNPKITAADPKAKFIAAAKNKKSKKKVI